MQHDHSNRGFLLPPGCRDLIDVIRIQQETVAHPPLQPECPPPFRGQLVLSERMSVRDIAALMGLKPFRLIADLIDLGIMATVDQRLEFTTLSKLVAKHGYIAIPVA